MEHRTSHRERAGGRAHTVAFYRLRSPEGILSWRGFAVNILSARFQIHKQTEPSACTGPFWESRFGYRASRALDHISAKNGCLELF